MLTAAVVEQNLGFSISVTEQGKKLLPMAGSMLERIVSPSVPALDFKEIDGENLAKLIEATTYTDAEGKSQHSVASDEVVNTISGLVRNHIKVSRETVLPIVKTVTEQIIEFDNKLKLYNAVNDVTIELFKVSSLMSDSSVLDMVENYKGATPIAPQSLTLGNMTKEEVLLHTSTGSNSLDNDVIQHYSNIDSSVVTGVYNVLFNYVDSSEGLSYIENTNSYDKFNKALLGFLLARKFFDDVHPNAANITLADYQAKVANIRDYCAALVIQAIEGIEYDNKTEKVILTLDRKNRIIKANDLMYKKWLETNTEEAILGCLVADRPFVTLPMIQDKKDQLVEAWNNYKTYLILRRTQDNSINLKNFMVNCIYNGLNGGLTDIENEYVKINPNHVESARKLADEFVAKLTDNDMDNLPEVSLALVTKCRFYFTSAYDILNGMHEVEKINPDISPREAALISIIYYVTDYFVSQVSVVPYV